MICYYFCGLRWYSKGFFSGLKKTVTCNAVRREWPICVTGPAKNGDLLHNEPGPGTEIGQTCHATGCDRILASSGTGRLALVAEEVQHEGGAFLEEEAAGNLGAGVEEGRGEEGVTAAGVRGTVHDAAHLGPGQGAGTHGAGLYRDIEGALAEVLAAHGFGGGSNGYHLRMGGGVPQALRLVMAPADDTPFPNHHRTDGDFPGGKGGLRVPQRLPHNLFILLHTGAKIAFFRR